MMQNNKTILPEGLTEAKLTEVLTKTLRTKIIRTDFRTEQLQGSTVGDIRLSTGDAETAAGDKLPYKVILKVQKKMGAPRRPRFMAQGI